MKKVLGLSLCIVAVLTFNHTVQAGKELKYPVFTIPDSLMKKSKAVVREDFMQFEVINQRSGKAYIKSAVTILKKSADHMAKIHIPYDKFISVKNIQGRIYNQLGVEVKQLKSKDIEDYSAYDGFSIFSDNRQKYFNLSYVDYPYTFEYEYEVEYSGLMFFPNWHFISDFETSVQHSSFSIKVPHDLSFRYKELNISSPATIEDTETHKLYTWEMQNIIAIEEESLMPHSKDFIPTILTAPDNFEIDGYVGSMKTWSDMGKWQQKLNENRNLLPENIRIKVQDLVKDIKDEKEKIKILYQYLQSNTRYVSVQLGIGGWQPFEAEYVAENGYGDCKALSNYMKSLLEEAGIRSYYTLIRAGRHASDIETDFPSRQFNHAILCVPHQSDTIWLECTSQDAPFGYMGYFTGNRHALVINDNGGKIVRTKCYRKEDNKKNMRTNVVLDETGNGTANIQIFCSGLQYDELQPVLDIGVEDQKKWLYRNIDIPGLKLIDFSFNRKNQPVPEITGKIQAGLNQISSVSSKRITFKPNILNTIESSPKQLRKRKYGFLLNQQFIDQDTTIFELPKGFKPEYIPEDVFIDSKFGEYLSKIVINENTIKYIRMFSGESGNFPPEDYQKYIDFINSAAEADKAKIVLVRTS